MVGLGIQQVHSRVAQPDQAGQLGQFLALLPGRDQLAVPNLEHHAVDEVERLFLPAVSALNDADITRPGDGARPCGPGQPASAGARHQAAGDRGDVTLDRSGIGWPVDPDRVPELGWAAAAGDDVENWAGLRWRHEGPFGEGLRMRAEPLDAPAAALAVLGCYDFDIGLEFSGRLCGDEARVVAGQAAAGSRASARRRVTSPSMTRSAARSGGGAWGWSPAMSGRSRRSCTLV